MRWLVHWFYMIRATIWLLGAFARAHLYFNNRALADLQLPHNELLTSQERRRLQHYFYGGTFLSIIFCTLRGTTRSDTEKHRLTNLAALAYFFDDLVDSFRDRDDTGILWRDNPEEYGLAADDHRRLALHFLHNIYEELPNEHLAAFKSVMHQVFNVETAGRQQTDNAIDLAEIDKITREKGGYSVLMFRMVHQPLPSPAEHEALLEFGHLIQYCDDIFDLWFDHQSNTITLATALGQKGQIDQMTLHFKQQIIDTIGAFRRIDAPSYRIETSLCVVHYISGITLVCLKHYQVLQQKYGVLPINDRKTIVVDMEKWRNRLRTAWELIKPLGAY
jgi:hypothetical protein